jgi:hypothetical protein
MTKLSKEQVVPAIKVLVGSSYVCVLDKEHAIEKLLAETRASDQKNAATDAITLLIDFFEENSRLNEGMESLKLAIKIGLEYRPHMPVAERVSKAAASSGFNICFPGLPIVLLNRQPDREEIELLICAYIAQKGDRGRPALIKLRDLANQFLPNAEAAAQLGRI